jgi:hypothetical protein
VLTLATQIGLALALSSVAHAQVTHSATPAVADTGGTASVTGTVFDSVARAPLGDADVQLVEMKDRSHVFTVHADSLGRFTIPSIPPGDYVAGFFHQSLDALGIEPPLRPASIHSGENVLELVIPGAARIMSAVCGARPATDSSGAMAGLVHDASTGFPLPGVKVIASWQEIVIDKQGLRTEQRRVPVVTTEDGSYRLCGLPGADTVLVSAELSARHSGLVPVAVPISGMVRRDFSIGDSTSAVAVVTDSAGTAEVRRETTVLRGSAALSGIVRGPDAKPMSGAKIAVWGTGLEATSGADGRFSLSNLPAGTFSVEARKLGFEPKRVAVDLSDRAPASVEIAFKERVNQLSRVVVRGKPRARVPDLDDFLRRSRTGMGHYITASDRILQNALTMTDAFRMTPGVHVVPSGSFGNVILMRGNCAPVVYLDGSKITDGYKSLDDIIPPQQVAGIEMYSGLGEAPVQYESNGCGVVLVWTKR